MAISFAQCLFYNAIEDSEQLTTLNDALIDVRSNIIVYRRLLGVVTLAVVTVPVILIPT